MRPWRYLGANPDSWWCTEPNCPADAVEKGIASDLSTARHLGITFVRCEFPWWLLEPTSGTFDWVRADRIVQTAATNGLQLVPVLVFAPAWAAHYPTDVPRADDWSRFVRAIVSRYCGTIHYWELWNEPDLHTYWRGTERQYVSSVLVPGYAAVKTMDPSAHVVLGAPHNANMKWLQGIFAFGGGASFDIMSWHEYRNGSAIAASGQLIQALLRVHRQAHKPLWLGEFGLQQEAPEDAGQVLHMQSVLLAEHSPIALAFWYSLRDDIVYTCCPPQVVKEAHWGVVQRDGTPKRAFHFLQECSAMGLPHVNTSMSVTAIVRAALHHVRQR